LLSFIHIFLPKCVPTVRRRHTRRHSELEQIVCRKLGAGQSL
jgi:hypothetical protein